MAAKKPNVVQKVRNHETYNKRVLLADDVNEFTESLNDHADKIDELTLIERTSAAGGIVFNKQSIQYILATDSVITVANLGHSNKPSYVAILTSGAAIFDKGDSLVNLEGDYESVIDGVYTFEDGKKHFIRAAWDGESIVGLFNTSTNIPAGITAPQFVSAEITNANPDQLRLTVDENCNYAIAGITLNTDGVPVTLSYLSGNGSNLAIYQINREISAGETLTLDIAETNGIVSTTSALDLDAVVGGTVTNNVVAAYSSVSSLSIGVVDEYIEIPHFAASTPSLASESWAYSIWVKVASYPAANTGIMAKFGPNSGGVNVGQQLAITTTGLVQTNVVNSSSKQQVYRSQTPIGTGSWVHLFWRYNNLVQQVYVNGVLQTLDTLANTLSGSDSIDSNLNYLALGRGRNVTSSILCNVDCASLFKSDGATINSIDVASIYNGGVPVDYTSFNVTPSHHWNCNESPVVLDSIGGLHGSGMNMDGTNVSIDKP